MTTEEKFNAAVNVIKSLPKDGAYQPSHDLKLRFYAYFKQATEGPCTVSKPAFWDVVGKVKWEAWRKLGNMSKQDAMTNYVEELKKIVETMSYNANVETFLGSLGNFYDTVPIEDLEMLLGPVIEKVRSQPGSPLKCSPLVSRETSPSRISNNLISNGKVPIVETSPISSMTPSPQPPDTEEEDEYIDTLENIPYTNRLNISQSNSPNMSKRNLDLPDDSSVKEKNVKKYNSNENGHAYPSDHMGSHKVTQNGVAYQLNGHHAEPKGGNLSPSSHVRIREKENPSSGKRRVAKLNGGSKTGSTHVVDVSEPIREAVLHLQKDLDRITSRVRSLEVNVLSQPQDLQSVELCEKCCENVDGQISNYEGSLCMPVADEEVKKRKWPFSEMSPMTAFFVVVWPFVAHFAMNYIQQRRNRQC